MIFTIMKIRVTKVCSHALNLIYRIFKFSIPPILDYKLRPSLEKFRMGPDHFEILPFIPMFMLLS